MPKKLQGVTGADLARSLGVSYPAVYKRLKAGKFSAAAFHEDGSFVEEVARVEWFANTNPSKMRTRAKDKAGPARPKTPGKHAEEAAKKRGEYEIKNDIAEVDLETKRINLAKLKGELVPRDDAKRAYRLVAYTTRELMMNFPAKHGAEIAGELGIDPGTLIGMLEAHIRKALVKAAEQPVPEFMNE